MISDPSDRELSKRLNEAKEFLKNRHGVFAEISKTYGELHDLDIGDSDDIWDLIKELKRFHRTITQGQDLRKSPMKKQ